MPAEYAVFARYVVMQRARSSRGRLRAPLSRRSSHRSTVASKGYLSLSQRSGNRRFTPRPLFPRVVVPLKGRSSGSRISRVCTPSQPRWASGFELNRLCSSSPVTATGSRRNYTDFPQVRSHWNCSCLSNQSIETIGSAHALLTPPQSSVRVSPDSRPKEHPPPSVVPLRISLAISHKQLTLQSSA